MRLAHIATGYPARFHGGITNYVRALASAQVDAGNEVTVFAGPETGERSSLPFKDVEFQASRLRPFSLRVVPFDAKAGDLAQEALSGKFDLIHFHMGLDLALNFYDRIAGGSIPYVVSIHDYFLVCPRITMIDYADRICRAVDLNKCARCIGVLDQFDLLEKGRRTLNLQLPRIGSPSIHRRAASMRRFLRNSARALPVSSRVKEILSSVEPDANYQVMHIGNASADAVVPSKKSSQFIRLTVLGVLSHHKGADIIEKLLDRITREDVRVNFYGRADESVLRRLKTKGLVYHGAYKPADLPRIMSKTDLGLVCPIWEDNAPQVVMEFLNFCVPVIGARIGGIPDFVDETNGILFDPYSDAEISRVSRWIDTLTGEALNTLKPLKKLKSPTEHGREVLALYQEILGERK